MKGGDKCPGRVCMAAAAGEAGKYAFQGLSLIHGLQIVKRSIRH
jgi:hypothetical protein